MLVFDVRECGYFVWNTSSRSVPKTNVETSLSPAVFWVVEALLISASNGAGLVEVGAGMLVRSIRTSLVCIGLIYGVAGLLVEFMAGAPSGSPAGGFVGFMGFMD